MNLRENRTQELIKSQQRSKFPIKRKKCVLLWQNKKASRLLDILFLLTLFTGRNVFSKEWDEDLPIIADHRLLQWGGQFHLSIDSIFVWQCKKTGKLYSDEEVKDIPVFNYNRVDLGFEKTLNKVLKLMASKKWQEKYNGGYFLFLFRQAVQRQIIETSFISCWTIWEHLFAVHNKNWLDNKSIEQTSGDKKIAYILNKYFLVGIDDTARKEIGRLKNTRNRIVHYGEKTDKVDYDEMEMFIRLTEQLIATTLELQPSNAFNSIDKLKDFLKPKKAYQQKEIKDKKIYIT